MSMLEFESKAALLDHLEHSPARTLLLGTQAEAPRRFYALSAGAAIEIGIISSDLGPKPALLLLDAGRRAVVGHDALLTWIDLAAASVVASRPLPAAFYELVALDRDDEVVVLHELGAMRVRSTGELVWSVDTGIVERSARDARGDLVLTIMDEKEPVIVSLEHGKK